MRVIKERICVSVSASSKYASCLPANCQPPSYIYLSIANDDFQATDIDRLEIIQLQIHGLQLSGLKRNVVGVWVRGIVASFDVGGDHSLHIFAGQLRLLEELENLVHGRVLLHERR
jgi:hypothetical protein